jgi:hypothetical protein
MLQQASSRNSQVNQRQKQLLHVRACKQNILLLDGVTESTMIKYHRLSSGPAEFLFLRERQFVQLGKTL